jgi:hypothetical protein
MNAEQKTICEFLKTYRNLFVSVSEISKALGDRKRFDQDRNWARPILRRMEMEGMLESNPFGEYRLKNNDYDTVSFKRALNEPGFALGDTTIIVLDEAEESDTQTRTSDTSLKEHDTQSKAA